MSPIPTPGEGALASPAEAQASTTAALGCSVDLGQWALLKLGCYWKREQHIRIAQAIHSGVQRRVVP